MFIDCDFFKQSLELYFIFRCTRTFTASHRSPEITKHRELQLPEASDSPRFLFDIVRPLNWLNQPTMRIPVNI